MLAALDINALTGATQSLQEAMPTQLQEVLDPLYAYLGFATQVPKVSTNQNRLKDQQPFTQV